MRQIVNPLETEENRIWVERWQKKGKIMPPVFDRYISIDWSGANRFNLSVPDLKVVVWRSGTTRPRLVRPTNGTSWSRPEVTAWLEKQLSADKPRSLVGIDAGFSFAWGTDRAFGVSGWWQIVNHISARFVNAHTAEATVTEANDWFLPEPGPFRLDSNRSDFRFYLSHQVAYWRLVETVVPQSISQWLSAISSQKVAYSTITVMETLRSLMAARDNGPASFKVWPQETWTLPDSGHVVVEIYPAIYPPLLPRQRTRNNNVNDALKAVRWMYDEDQAGRLTGRFNVPHALFGRVDGISFQRQVEFEGWILGVS